MYDKVGGGVSDTSHIPFPFSSSSHRYLLGGATAQRAPTGSKEYKCQQNLEGEGASLFRGPQLFLLFVYLTSTPLLSELASLHSHSLSTISWSSLFSRNRVHSTLKYTHFSTEHPPPKPPTLSYQRESALHNKTPTGCSLFLNPCTIPRSDLIPLSEESNSKKGKHY